MASKLTYVTFAYLMTIVTSSGVELVERQKRGDDGGALGIVVDQLSQQMNSVKAHQDSMQTRLTALEAQTAARNRTVAFQAFHSSVTISTSSLGTLIFDQVVTNLGGGYDPGTSVFTAPVAGDYVFLATFMQFDPNGARVAADIMVDGVRAVLGLAEDVHHGSYSPVTINAVVHLQAGSKVLVRNAGSATAFYGGPYSNFSGFLLRQE